MPKKILIVDDEKDVVLALLKRLSTRGYQATYAASAEEALGAVKKEKFDLIILDILMPHMDGTELGQVLKNDLTTKDIPLIFLTALGSRWGPQGYDVAGPDIVFAKPFESEELIRKIDEILTGRI